jgi:hypothetical protein
MKNLIIIAPPKIENYLKILDRLKACGWSEICPSPRYHTYLRMKNGILQELRVDFWRSSI